ncbi:hypothetical protein INR49_012072 [Caranx melampygus]|nr:hypothetical protein INR49_012072 [Caranx melampygus]
MEREKGGGERAVIDCHPDLCHTSSSITLLSPLQMALNGPELFDSVSFRLLIQYAFSLLFFGHPNSVDKVYTMLSVVISSAFCPVTEVQMYIERTTVFRSAVYLLMWSFLWTVTPAEEVPNSSLDSDAVQRTTEDEQGQLGPLFTGNLHTEVSCVFMESCILPCSFQGGKDVVLHWIQLTAGGLPVHSYYHNQDQLTYQGQSFRGRTSLFKDQISRGNASLQLTGVKVQDQGRYKCFTSTMSGYKESFINLNVDAPVVKVDFQQVGNNITCSSERIYPEPQLTWSTSPPSNVAFKNQTKVQETEQLLYNISGSLILSDTDLIYSCTISTRSNWRRVTLLKTGGDLRVHSYYHNQDQLTPRTRASEAEHHCSRTRSPEETPPLHLTGVKVQDQGRYKCFTSTMRGNKDSFINLKVDASIDTLHTEATIPCSTSVTFITGFSLTWRFNHSQIILTQTRADVPCTVSEEWKQQLLCCSQHTPQSAERNATLNTRNVKVLVVEDVLTHLFLN